MEKMNTAAAAAYIRKSPSWLNKSRLNGNGPVYLKVGGTVTYLKSDLDVYLTAQRRTAVYAHANDDSRAMASAA